MAVDVCRPHRQHLAALDPGFAGSNAGHSARKRNDCGWHLAESGPDCLRPGECEHCDPTGTGASGLRVLWNDAEAEAEVATRSSVSSGIGGPAFRMLTARKRFFPLHARQLASGATISA